MNLPKPLGKFVLLAEIMRVDIRRLPSKGGPVFHRRDNPAGNPMVGLLVSLILAIILVAWLYFG